MYPDLGAMRDPRIGELVNFNSFKMAALLVSTKDICHIEVDIIRYVISLPSSWHCGKSAVALARHILGEVLPSTVRKSNFAGKESIRDSPGAAAFGPAPDARGGRNDGLAAAVVLGRPARRLDAVRGRFLEKVLLKLAEERKKRRKIIRNFSA